MRHLLFVATTLTIAILSFTSSAESQGKKKAKTPIWSDVKDVFGDPLPIGAIARIGTIRYRLPEGRQPNSAVLSPDGKLLAVAGFTNDIDLWELPAWTRQRKITGRSIDKKAVLNFNSVTFTHNGKQLVAFDSNAPQVHFIDIESGKSVRKIVFPKGAGNRDPYLTLSLDQKFLVCATFNDQGKNQSQQYHVWDLAKDKLLHTLDVPTNRFAGTPPRPALSADARWLAQVVGKENPNARNGVDTHIEIWDLIAGKTVHKIDNDGSMRLLALSPDGKWLAATDGGSYLRFFDAAAAKELHNVRLRRTAISHLQFAPDSTALFVAEYDGTIRQWDPVKGVLIAIHKTDANAAAYQLRFLADGDVRALGFGVEAIHYWDVKSGKVLSPTGVPEGFIDDIAFSPNGELFVASEDGHAAWWNPRTAVKLRDLKLESAGDLAGGRWYPYAVGPRDIVLDGGGPLRGGASGLMTMSSRGDFLASGNGAGLTIYDARTGKLLYDDGSTSNNFQAFAFIDGGQKTASVQGKKIRVWNTRTGRDVMNVDLPVRNQEHANKLSAAAKGRYFAVITQTFAGDNNQSRGLLFDADKNKLVREWPVQNREDHMRFSPDDQWLAIASSPNRVRLTRLNKPRGDHLLDLGKGSEDLTHLAFSPDGRQLAVGAIVPRRDNDASKIVIFEMASRKVRLELAGHHAGIIDRLAYSHDGNLLASGATDTTVLVWRAGLLAFADKRAEKDASADELNDWFEQLANVDARVAFNHMIKLAQTPAQAVTYLDSKIAPAKKPDTGDKTIPQWIHDLGSSTFIVRTRANSALLKLAGAAEPELVAALPKSQDVETKRRIEELLDRIALNEWSTEEIRQARAVEVLEAIGTPEARAVLTRWTGGEPAAVLTQVSRKALAALK